MPDRGVSPMRPDESTSDLSRLLGSTPPVSLVVGIPSFNNAATIPHVTESALHGALRYFPGETALVLNSDGGSGDGTPKAVADAFAAAVSALPPEQRDRVLVRSIRYRGTSGKGSAFRDIFEAAASLEAKAVVVLDADLRSVTPEWIGRLTGPLVSGEADFVAPLYRRHRFDGTITNSIVYPLTDAVFGGKVRQPIGGDFGLSGRLADVYATAKNIWDTDVARFGIDLWMTTTALAEGFRVAQAHLGAKIHDPKDPGLHLAGMLAQVVGTAFALLERYEETWTMGVSAPDAPVFGEARHVVLDPVKVDIEGMVRQFRFGVENLGSVYRVCLAPAVWRELSELAYDPAPVLHDVLWARIIVQFAVAHHRRVIPRDQLVRSLTPLYLGRTATFVRRNLESTEDQAEAEVQALAAVFRGQARELLRLWKEGP